MSKHPDLTPAISAPHVLVTPSCLLCFLAVLQIYFYIFCFTQSLVTQSFIYLYVLLNEWRILVPRFALLSERGNENIKKIISSFENRTHNLSSCFQSYATTDLIIYLYECNIIHCFVILNSNYEISCKKSTRRFQI